MRDRHIESCKFASDIMLLNERVIAFLELPLLFGPLNHKRSRFRMKLARPLMIAFRLIRYAAFFRCIIQWVELLIASGFLVVTESPMPEPLADDHDRRTHFELHHTALKWRRVLVAQKEANQRRTLVLAASSCSGRDACIGVGRGIIAHDIEHLYIAIIEDFAIEFFRGIE